MIIDKDHRRVQAAVRGTILHYNRVWRKAPSQIWRDKTYRSWWNRRHQTDQLVSTYIMVYLLGRYSSMKPKDRTRCGRKITIKKYPNAEDIEGMKQCFKEIHTPKFLVNLLVDAKQQ